MAELNSPVGLRDWVAALALQGLLAGPNITKKSGSESPAQYARRVAEEAYLFADAFLQAKDEPSAK
jgi:hypothetical protein